MTSWTQTKTAVVAGTAIFLVIIAIALAGKAVHSARVAHYPNIQGAWEGTVEIPQAKLRVRLNLSRTNGTYAATGDSIDQGVRNIPVSKIVYNYPAFHFEMQSVGGIYDGSLNPAADEISGTWKQGNATLPLAFKHVTNAVAEALSEDAFAPRADSDVQGIWKGALQLKEGTALRLNFKIAEQPPGTFQIRLDSVDQGVKDIEASSASYQDHVLKAEFAGLNGSFEGRVDGREIAGTWAQAGSSLPLILERADATGETEQEPIKNYYIGRNNLPGHWKGTLQVQNVKLRVVFNIAQLPDGSLAATMDSPDQGATDLPATTVQHTPPNVKIEWKGIGGVFNGTLKNGKLTGKWRQGGAAFPLNLSRG
jgi:hypothetical protein